MSASSASVQVLDPSAAVIPYGKYKGQKLADVYAQDREYVRWLSGMNPRTDEGRRIKAAAQALIANAGGNGNGHVPGNGNGRTPDDGEDHAPGNGGSGRRSSSDQEKTPVPEDLEKTSGDTPTTLTPEVAARLREPFDPRVVGWKAQATTKDKSRAQAVAYVDARVVASRLDKVVGPGAWQDEYRVLRDAEREVVFTDQNGQRKKKLVRHVEVECSLTILGVTKRDVGDGEDLKAAYSDAFKRAAVKFGVARYLYSLPKYWVPYDAKSKKLLQVPQLPDWAKPKR